MKKIFIAIIGLVLVTSSLLLANAANDTLQLSFSEDCQERNGCVVYQESNNSLIKTNPVVKGETFTVDIAIFNPQAKEINSVKAWIKYDTTVLKANDIDSSDSPFELSSPDGEIIDSQDGIVKIGRAAAGKKLSDTSIYVASIDFEVISSTATTTNLSFLNFQGTELGDTGIFSVSGLLVDNILQESPKNLLITLNSSTVSVNTNQNNTNVDPFQDLNNQVINKLERPTGLRIKSGDKKVDLQWIMKDDKNISGYYVYYSTTSGSYTMGRDIGNTNHATISDLNNGTKYYFSIKAYDSQRNMSDYADEVFTTVGVANSESHPFYTETTNVTTTTNNNSQASINTTNNTNQNTSYNQDISKSGPEDSFLIILGITITILAIGKIIIARFFFISKRI